MPELVEALKEALRKLPKNTVKAMQDGYEKTDQVATIAYRTVVTGAKSAVGKKTDAGDIQKSASEVKKTVKELGQGIKEGSRDEEGRALFGAGAATEDETAALEEHRQEALRRMEQSKAHVANLAKLVGEFSVGIRKLARETDWGVVTSDGGKLLEDSSKLDSLLKTWQQEANKAFANVEKGIETASAGDIGVRIMQMADIQNFEAPLTAHVGLVADHVAKLTMNAAEKSAVDVSFKKEFGWSVLFGSLRVVISAAAALGQTQVPGVGSAGEVINSGVLRLERFAKTVRRDNAIKKRRAADGPDWAIKVLNQPDARLRVAQRVCAKQEQHVLDWLNFAGIAAASTVPGWGIIKTAVRSAVNMRFEAKVKTLEVALNRARAKDEKLGGIAEEMGEAAKELAVEFRVEAEEEAKKELENAAEQIAEAVAEPGGRERFIREISEVFAQLDAEDAIHAVTGFAESFGVSVAGLLITKLGAYLLGKAQVLEPAQMVTGDDFEFWIASFDEGMADIAEAGSEDGF
ncbi:hypothetical protein [Labedaea rhizosphaerae]|uniref:Uncharacterized protein n=1 Tax=Labedaea rhizosphaerae TaxID=598644 RepID=A0A4R6RVZ5_LABRH|nr:hypothetical protein [Labedaea rhizosphaerae]TDP90617.1 hypothetical protein EV186_110158 [Labedaea rhizosphaerae]